MVQQRDRDKELEREQTMLQLGEQRFKEIDRRAKEREQESTTTAGKQLLAMAIEPTAAAIKAFLKDASSGRAGRARTAAKYLKLVDPEITAFLVARTVLDGISRRRTLQSIALTVGNFIEDEVRFAQLRRTDPGLFIKLDRQTQSSTSYRHRRTVFSYAANKAEVDWKFWGKVDKIHLGTQAIDLFRVATGLVDYKLVRRLGKTKYYLVITEETQKWILDKNASCSLLSPMWLPMTVPPRDWSCLYGGGYHLDGSMRYPLIKSYDKDYLRYVRRLDMPVIFQSVNVLQRVPWRINTRVLDIMRQTWEAGASIGGLPAREDELLPPKPEDIATNLDARKQWKRAASEVHGRNAIVGSRRLQVAKILWVAKLFTKEPRIYFPHQLDFRGRLYPKPLFLSPQGADYSRALLEFTEGKVPATREAIDWFMIHGANLWGEDKVSFQERIEWAEINWRDIRASAEDPLGNLWWTEADSPWQFLAWCFEYDAMARGEVGFKSHLPIHLDGSCNGLQHFSAMLRDDVGGLSVNLVPQEKPADIYQDVADLVTAKLEEDKRADVSKYAAMWLEAGITRQTTKRAVMTLPYGVTQFRCRDYVQTHFTDRIKEEGLTCIVEGREFHAACGYLSDIVWEAIGKKVRGAKVVMAWLQNVTRIANEKGIHISWISPSGFPVWQGYRNVVECRIKTAIAGRTIRYRLNSDDASLNNKRQINGVAPNFVHSMDAAALHLTVCAASLQGVSSFSMVHDSYATLAADTPTLARTLRYVFVDMYERHDVLTDFRESILAQLPKGVELPPVPERGSLELGEVLDSEFFFA